MYAGVLRGEVEEVVDTREQQSTILEVLGLRWLSTGGQLPGALVPRAFEASQNGCSRLDPSNKSFEGMACVYSIAGAELKHGTQG